MGSRSHVHPVFLPAELYIGVARVEAHFEIGKSAAILLMITEGLYQHRLISQEDHNKFTLRYRQKLVEKVNAAGEKLGKCGFRGCKKDSVALGLWHDKDELPLCEEHLKHAEDNQNEWQILRFLRT